MLTNRTLTSMNALRRGVDWQPAHAEVDRRRRLLVAGDFRLLFARTPSPTNGLDAIDVPDIVKLPYPAAIVSSAVDMVHSDVPGLQSDNATIATWLRQNGAALTIELEKATRELAITGYGVLLARDGQLVSVDATAWQPVVDAADASIPLGSVLAFVYRSDAADHNKLPDRLRVVRVPREGVARVATYEYTPGKIGRAIAGLQDAPTVAGLWTIGNGVSFIDGIEDTLFELCIRYTSIARAASMHTNPSMQGPADSPLASGNHKYSPKGNYLPRSDPADGYSMLTWDPKLDAQFGQIDRLTRQLALLSGSTLALHISGPEASGASRQVLMTSAASKANRIRRQIESVPAGSNPAPGGRERRRAN